MFFYTLPYTFINTGLGTILCDVVALNRNGYNGQMGIMKKRIVWVARSFCNVTCARLSRMYEGVDKLCQFPFAQRLIACVFVARGGCHHNHKTHTETKPKTF